MRFLESEIAPLGMGCWPIGGAMFNGDKPLGYAGADDTESRRTIHAALDAGITLFDTAAAYGAGHSERVLGAALRDRPDAVIVTKIGIGIDEGTKQLSFDAPGRETVRSAIDGCLRRLGRDRIDLVLLHQNEMPIDAAAALFDEMETARAAGKIRSYGWSTDFADRAVAFADRDGFVAVQHAMNILVDAPRIQDAAHKVGLHTLIRSPLGMGLLTGKYGATETLPASDIRAGDAMMVPYFQGARANPAFLDQLAALRDLLTTGGRTLVQGALGWLWAKSDGNIPIPGARTVEQIEGIAGALAHGPLPSDVMAEIETLIDRPRYPEDRQL